MSSNPEPQGIDWDSLFTFFLTLVVVMFGLGLPLFVTYLHALRIAITSRCRTQHRACLLVFGKRLTNGVVDQDYRLRLDKAAELIEQDPDRSVILLGGTPRSEQVSEARTGLNYLKEKGVDGLSGILLEEGSRNTLENLRHARKILQSTDSSPTLLITNRYHLARSRMIASSLGIKHALCPAEASFPFTPSVMGRLVFEAFYILWFTAGKTWARLTGNQRMLRRVT